LIDPDFALTARGFRALHDPESPTVPTAEAACGVVAADAARARLLLLRCPDAMAEPAAPQLHEVQHLSHPLARTRDSVVLSDTRPGLRREGPSGPRHAVSDRRERRRRADDRRFAREVVTAATELFSAHAVERVVVVASPKMLGLLRAVLRTTKVEWSSQELGRDLSRLPPPALHDALAAEGLLPPRVRLSTWRRGASGGRRQPRAFGGEP
jgi:protein required for attachment to host cells